MGDRGNRRPPSKTSDDRKTMVSAAIRATTEISQLPKNGNWMHDGEYVRELMGHILEICDRYGLLPTLSHLAAALSVSKETIDDVRTGYVHANPDVVTHVIEYYQVCESVTLSTTLSGAINNIAGIFALKSQYGYKEEPREVVFTSNKIVGGLKDTKAIAEKYRECVVVDEAETKPADSEYDF